MHALLNAAVAEHAQFVISAGGALMYGNWDHIWQLAHMIEASSNSGASNGGWGDKVDWGGYQSGDDWNPNEHTVLQTGGHTIRQGTAEALGKSQEQVKQGIEAMKRDLGLGNNFHGKIWSDGTVTDMQNNPVGNLLQYIH